MKYHRLHLILDMHMKCRRLHMHVQNEVLPCILKRNLIYYSTDHQLLLPSKRLDRLPSAHPGTVRSPSGASDSVAL